MPSVKPGSGKENQNSYSPNPSSQLADRERTASRAQAQVKKRQKTYMSDPDVVAYNKIPRGEKRIGLESASADRKRKNVNDALDVYNRDARFVANTRKEAKQQALNKLIARKANK
jgi:hypothetical protein